MKTFIVGLSHSFDVKCEQQKTENKIHFMSNCNEWKCGEVTKQFWILTPQQWTYYFRSKWTA